MREREREKNPNRSSSRRLFSQSVISESPYRRHRHYSQTKLWDMYNTVCIYMHTQTVRAKIKNGHKILRAPLRTIFQRRCIDVVIATWTLRQYRTLTTVNIPNVGFSTTKVYIVCSMGGKRNTRNAMIYVRFYDRHSNALNHRVLLLFG